MSFNSDIYDSFRDITTPYQEKKVVAEKLEGIMQEIGEISANLVQLNSVELLKEILSFLKQDRRGEAEEAIGKAWPTLEREYYSLAEGSSSIPPEKKKKFWKIASLIEEAEDDFIAQGLDTNVSFSLGGDSHIRTIKQDMWLPPDKRTYTVLLQELMQAVSLPQP
ncbi:MAG: hypothetical protein PHW01_00405 [Patescibacteria group bacterium]|nr:hypothetical protein [Patescibacteria group bacterium]